MPTSPLSINQFDGDAGNKIEIELQAMGTTESVESRSFDPRNLLRRHSHIMQRERIQSAKVTNRGRLIEKRRGTTYIRQENRTSAMKKQQYTKDGFHTLLDASWLLTMMMFAATYVITWLFYAIVWHIANQVDDSCVGKMKTFNGAMEFSIETQQAIGYGDKYIEENCVAGTFIVVCQELTARLCECFWIGLVFLKMSKPTKRGGTLKYSSTACIGVKHGDMELAIRVGDTSIHADTTWVQPRFSLYIYEEETTSTGFHQSYSQKRLKLVDDGPLFILPLEVRHCIDENSPLFGRSAQDLIDKKVEVVLVFECVIQSTGNALHMRTSYSADEIEFGKMFVEMNYRSSGGHPYVDWDLFDDTIPCATFNDSTKFIPSKLGTPVRSGSFSSEFTFQLDRDQTANVPSRLRTSSNQPTDSDVDDDTTLLLH